MENFDEIISFGNTCQPAVALMDLKLREEAYPFDWTLSNPKIILDYILNGDKNFLDFNHSNINELFLLDKRYPKNYIINKFVNKNIKPDVNINEYVNYYGMCFTHFVNMSSIQLYETFKRRCDRFNNILNSDKKILFIYFNTEYNLCEEDYLNLLQIETNIINKYPKLNFKILSISPIIKENTNHIINYFYDGVKKEINNVYYGNPNNTSNGNYILLNFLTILLKNNVKKKNKGFFN
jgi:hypothetical protein